LRWPSTAALELDMRGFPKIIEGVLTENEEFCLIERTLGFNPRFPGSAPQGDSILPA